MLDPRTCLLGFSNGPLDPSTCLLGLSTCLLRPSTSLLDPSTCLLGLSTCLLGLSTCLRSFRTRPRSFRRPVFHLKTAALRRSIGLTVMNPGPSNGGAAMRKPTDSFASYCLAGVGLCFLGLAYVIWHEQLGLQWRGFEEMGNRSSTATLERIQGQAAQLKIIYLVAISFGAASGGLATIRPPRWPGMCVLVFAALLAFLALTTYA